MRNPSGTAFETMSEADFEPVLALIQGGDPEVIARKSGMNTEQLFKIRDDLLAAIDQERVKAAGYSAKKIGRNDPCPCGSGKKYKHCCLNLRPRDRPADPSAEDAPDAKKEAEQARLITAIEKAFKLLQDGQPKQAIARATRLIRQYPNEDRLYDIVSTAHVYAGDWDAAIGLCRRRLVAAEREKAYFIAHSRHRDADIDQPALAYHYPPLTWLQKTWIALKARDYAQQRPPQADPAITRLVHALQTADDGRRFPQTQTQGLDLRRKALKAPLEQLKSGRPEVIPYLLPLTVKYAWAGLLVPEILSAYPTERSTRSLIDISMFGFSYVSGACLHYLEKRGAGVIPYIEEAFFRDKEFDPIKTGIISVLGNLRTPAAYRLLLKLIAHDSPHIVNWAGDALGKYERVEALPVLEADSERIGGEAMIDAAILRLKDIQTAG